MPLIPLYRMNLKFEYKPVKYFSLLISNRFVSERYLQNDISNARDKLKSFDVTDIGFNLFFAKVKIFFIFKNIFNLKYNEVGAYAWHGRSFTVTDQYFPSPGFSFESGLTCNF